MKSLPAPNLDDRTFNDIREEAIRRIQKSCPEWTDFNPSDPGATLVEVLAWMTETIIYRLNRVPDKNYVKFLELLGTRLRPAQGARAWLVFDVVKATRQGDPRPVPAGTRVSTLPAGAGDEPIVFETLDHLNLTACSIVAAGSQSGEKCTDHTSDLLGDGGREETPLFLGETDAPHELYLGDSALGPSGAYIALKLFVTLLVESSLGVNLQWEWWDGQDWCAVDPSTDATLGLRKSGEIVFDSIPDMVEREVQGHLGSWLRARLIGTGGATLPRVTELTRGTEVQPQHGFLPEKGYVSTEREGTYRPVDFSGIVYPFGKEPARNDAFYVSSPVLSKVAAQIQLSITLAETYTPSSSDELGKLEVWWEYYSREREWKLLGITTPLGVQRSEHGFEDETDAFTHSGVVRFTCPGDTSPVAVQTEESSWVRARIVKGHYGVKEGTPPLNPPVIRTFRVAYREKPKPFEHYLAHDYFSYRDLTELAAKGQPFDPFVVQPEKGHAFYLAFDKPPSDKRHRVYFRTAQEGTAPADLLWEYSARDAWRELGVLSDTSRGLGRSGAIEFVPPADWSPSLKFEKTGYWLRARWETGRYSMAPLLKSLHVNAVEAVQAESIRDEPLGTSNGQPYQSFRFSRSPVLPGPSVLVREFEHPSAEEVARAKRKFGDDVVEEKDRDTGEVKALWIRWHQRDDFSESHGESRHYRLNLHDGAMEFGDGRRGWVPLAGMDIKCEVYRTVRGAKGNVGANTLTVLMTGHPDVDEVTNPDAAGGGADAETLDEAKVRGPWLLKHRARAVTSEDFEKLALEASGNVAKAVCLMEREGEVKVVIVPKGAQQRLFPSRMLREEVTAYLEERRLIGTRIRVCGPGYTSVSIEAEVVLEPQKLDQPGETKDRMIRDLKRFFHPLRGGSQEDGWPMGRAVHVSEIYYLLERVEGVDYVKRVVLNRSPWITRVGVGDTSFPHLKEIAITVAGG